MERVGPWAPSLKRGSFGRIWKVYAAVLPTYIIVTQLDQNQTTTSYINTKKTKENYEDIVILYEELNQTKDLKVKEGSTKPH